MEYRTATRLLQALRAGQVSAVELTEQAIARIEAEDGRLNAVVVRDFAHARESARAADAALARGVQKPLLGLPMTVKESFNLAGHPTTWGIFGTETAVVPQDAVAVARLRQAGAVILGKTNVSTYLQDWQAANPVYGVTSNPWDISRTPGGSSGGSAAALAAGYVALELGSDLAGSLRVPAHFCGIFSHKPSHDLVPGRGQAPPGAPLLSVSPYRDLAVVGPMARSAEDLMLALDVLAGPDEAQATAYELRLPPPRHASLRDYRVLVIDRHPLTPTDDGIRGLLAAMARRLEKAGCKVGHDSPLLPDLAVLGRTYIKLLMAFIGTTIPDEAYLQAQERAAALSGGGDLGALGKRSLVASHRDWMQAHYARTAIAHRWRALFREWDVVLCPVMPVAAFKHDHRPMDERTVMVNGEAIPYGLLPLWPSVATLTGQPATAMPIGLDAQGLPVGMQVIGPYLEDRTTLAFAALAEQAFGGFVPPPAASATRREN